MGSDLVDDLYEASVATERWPFVLDKLTRLGGGAGASFITMGEGPLCLAATPLIEELIRDYAQQPHQNIRIDAGLRTIRLGFFSDADLLTPEQIESSPFFTEFLRPRGLGWMFGTIVRAPSATPIIFSVERRFEDGLPDRRLLDRFDAMRPHMARALLLATRLGLARARAKVEALALVGLPAAVVDRFGRVVAMNELCEALVPHVLADRRARLVFSDGQADPQFADALSAVTGDDLLGAARVPQSFPVRRSELFPGGAAHVIPVRGNVHDILSPGAAVVLLTPLAPAPGPDAGLLEALFDLTPAEARIAAGIGDAQSVEQLAQRFNLSRETVRGHLKLVFAKTGTKRQVELVHLLARLPRLGSGPEGTIPQI